MSGGDHSRRVRMLEKKREREVAAVAAERARIAKRASKGTQGISKKFAARSGGGEQKLKESTYGLVSLDEYKQRKMEALMSSLGEATDNAINLQSLPDADSQQHQQQQQQDAENRAAQEAADTARALEEKRKRVARTSTLSFAGGDDDSDDSDDSDDDSSSSDNPAVALGSLKSVLKRKRGEGAEEEAAGEGTSVETTTTTTTTISAEASATDSRKRRKTLKNPNVETGFLPDWEREEAEARERAQIAAEWKAEQERIKEEEIEVTYSFWDGRGHRRTIRVTKGTTIRRFLDLARAEFEQLRFVSPDQLMYIKEDLIIPHHYSFYDFIVTKARGKSGPLFSFDVHEDVRLVSNARVEKDESHAGKVVERRWYERNKTYFPANRWEVYDPKKDYGKYSIK